MQDDEGTGKRTRAPRRQRRPRGQLHCVPDKASGILYIKGKVRGIEVRESTGTRDVQTADALRVKREAELLNESVHGKKVSSTFADCVVNYKRQKDGGSNNRYLPALVEYFGDMRVKDMTPTVIKDYADDVHAGCQGQTKNVYVINPIVTVLRRAAFDQLCDPPAIERYEETPEKVTGAPASWLADFLAKCDRIKVRAYVSLITTTGCRGIDAVRLRTENVNYEKGTAFLPKTKNDDARTLQLVGPVAELFKLFQHSPDGRVFGYSRTDVANREIADVCKRQGLEYYSGHRVGRHAFAERLLGEGRTLQEVMKAGGWRDIDTLSGRYGHLEQSKVDDMVRDQASRVLRTGLKIVGGKE